MSALLIVGLASITGPWFILLAPVVAGLFLLAPPIGIYKHDETPAPRTGVRLEASEIDDTTANVRRFRLVLVNPGSVPASNFRIRLLVPHSLVPATASSKLLGPLHTGVHGRNWFIDSAYDATAITFRAGHAGAEDEIWCPPESRLDLADLNLLAQTQEMDITLDYQVSGGSASPSLDRLRLQSPG